MALYILYTQHRCWKEQRYAFGASFRSAYGMENVLLFGWVAYTPQTEKPTRRKGGPICIVDIENNSVEK